jgi:hypothetical protein
MKSSLDKTQNISMFTNFKKKREIVHLVMRPVIEVVGVRDQIIARNFPKSIVVHSVTRADVLDLSQGNVAIYFVLEVAQDQNNLIVWLVVISTMMVFVNKNVPQCKDTILSSTNGRKIPTENTLMAPPVYATVQNIF